MLSSKSLKKIGNINFKHVYNGDDEALKVMLATGNMPFNVFDARNCNKLGRDYSSSGSLLELSHYKNVMPNLTAMGDKYISLF